MKNILILLLILLSYNSNSQPLISQYVNGKKRVGDSIGYYVTGNGRYIDKITTAGCYWNLWDYTRNVYDSLRLNSSGVPLSQLNDTLLSYTTKYYSNLTYEILSNKTTNLNTPDNTKYPTSLAVVSFVNSSLNPVIVKTDSNLFKVGGYVTPTYYFAHLTDTTSLNNRKVNKIDSNIYGSYITQSFYYNHLPDNSIKVSKIDSNIYGSYVSLSYYYSNLTSSGSNLLSIGKVIYADTSNGHLATKTDIKNKQNWDSAYSKYPSSLSFIGGVLTLNTNSSSSIFTSLDGRYIITETDPIYSNSVAAYIKAIDTSHYHDGWAKYILSGIYSAGTITFTRNDGSTFGVTGIGGGSVSSVSGTTNRITSTGGVNPVIDISSSYIGQSSISTLGTITSGVWNGTSILDAYISSASSWNAKQSASLNSGYVWIGSSGNTASGYAPSGDWTISNTGIATLKNTGTSGTYGSATAIPSFTTDPQGRITSVLTYTFTSGGSTTVNFPLTNSGTSLNPNISLVYSTTPTANTIPQWDGNKNLSANNLTLTYTVTATAGTTTTLTASSPHWQEFTGTSNQDLKMPVTSTIGIGTPYFIINNSSGIINVISSGGNAIITVFPLSSAVLFTAGNSLTTASDWRVQYSPPTVISLTSTGNVTFTIPPKTVISCISVSPVSTVTLVAGTTSGGNDVFNSQSFTGSVLSTVDVVDKQYSRTINTTVYIQGAGATSVTYDIFLMR